MKVQVAGRCLLVALVTASVGRPARDGVAESLHRPGRPVTETPPGSLSDLPPAAQAQISAAVGKGQPGYHAVPLADGFRVKNSGHGLAADFTPAAVRVRAGTATWGLSLVGYGYSDALSALTTAAPQAEANRIEYRRGDLTEWYVNGPLGLEQGFTLAKAPGKSTGEPLTLSFRLSGNLIASADPTAKDAVLRRPDGTAELRYRGLTAHDATGRELRSWLEVDGDRLRLRVDDTGARYPVVVDPFIEQAKLTASDGSDGDQFGTVAIDGDTIVVGAHLDDVGANANQGSAYVFVKPAGGWSGPLTEQARLVASDGAVGDFFGLNVAVSGDTIVVGARLDDVVRSGVTRVDQGSAYVFVQPAGGWNGTLNESAKLTSSAGAATDWFGDKVAISGDVVVVGARLDDIGAGCLTCDPIGNRGSAYVFVKPAAGWSGNRTQNATLNPSIGFTGDEFGMSVAIDGDTIVVGAWLTGSDSGSAYVYVKPAAGWSGNLSQNARLLASDAGVNDRFGVSIDVSGDTVVVGSYFDDRGAIDQGSAYVFVKPPASGWSGNLNQTAKLIATDAAAGDQFGNTVAVSGDTVAIGARFDNVGPNSDQGSVYTFVKPATGWNGTLTENHKLTASDGAAFDLFGLVALSGDTLLVGAPTDDVGVYVDHGSAYVFVADPLPSDVLLTPPSAENPVGTTHTVTAMVEDVDDQPIEGVIVRFNVAGSVTTSGDCTTDAAGMCSFTYGGPTAPGFDDIVAFADIDGDGAQGPDEPEGFATKTWVAVDDDGDGVPDESDNCPSVANADQADADEDFLGDACDACPSDALNDADADGVCGNVDNCPSVSNGDQVNGDGDALGDACDACPNDAANDADADGVCGNVDNCPSVANTNQANADGDAFGDACDACPNDAANDADADGVCGDVDNCPSVANTNQANGDGDTLGDACDACPQDAANDADGDGLCANIDNCPFVGNPDQVDTDGDGFGNACDPFFNHGFRGLLAPYTAPPKRFKGNRTIPLKWQYTGADGSVVESADADPTVIVQGPVPCGQTASGEVLDVSAAGDSGYQYDGGTGTWQFNWTTTGLPSGCYYIQVMSPQAQPSPLFAIQLE
jgi:hypothetical protein